MNAGIKCMVTAAVCLCAAFPLAVQADKDDAVLNGKAGHEFAEETEQLSEMNPAEEETDTGMRMSESVLCLSVSETYILEAYADEAAEDQPVIWSSDDTSVASVDENGTITALRAGTAHIKAERDDGSYAVCEVNVDPVWSESVVLSSEEVAIVYGESTHLLATVLPSDATDQNVVWSSSDESVATVDQSGNIRGLKPGRTFVGAEAADGNSEAVCTVDVLFSDVADGQRYYYDPVYWAVRTGVTVGYGGAGRFSPHRDCTREQIITFMWRMAGEPEPSSFTAFTDVKKTDWFYQAVCWAAENGITVGLNDGTGRFGTGQPCGREMCVTFLYRAAGSPKVSSHPSFKDVKSSSYYYDAVAWASENSITNGLNDGTGRFGTGIACTRAMIVSLLYREKTGVAVVMDGFMTETDNNGRSYIVYVKDGRILKEDFRLNQTYYRVDKKTGEIIHSQKLFNDRIWFEGIDISEHNGEIDLKEYENGFVIIRVAWGTNADVLAKRNMDLCEKLNIPYGVYLYSYAVNDEQVESEADFMLDMIRGRNIELGVWYDIEDDNYKAARISGWPNSNVISRHCRLFCDKISAAGYHAGIYTSASWFTAYVRGLSRYDRWMAHWGINDGAWNIDLTGKCSIHQYTSVPLDRNVFYTDPLLMH